MSSSVLAQSISQLLPFFRHETVRRKELRLTCAETVPRVQQVSLDLFALDYRHIGMG